MKLQVFRSEKGDCLLLTSKNNKRMLIDGGMAASYTLHVAPELAKLRPANKKIDLIYVSHIDRDHISGVLQLLDDEAEWRVHLFQTTHGNPTHPEPRSKRPPKIGGIWNNAFHDQVDRNTGKVEEALAASAPLLSAADSPAVQADGQRQAMIAQSIQEAIQVSSRISQGQLKIPLNAEFGGKLATVEGVLVPTKLGTVELSLIGPFAEDVTKLRKEWNAWLEDSAGIVANLQRRAMDDQEDLGQSAFAWPASQLVALGNELGVRSKVTTPNLASIMLYAEELGKKLLLTGDGHWADIIKGLDKRGKRGPDGKLHLNVLKVQHHGSEHNISQDFCDSITADNYLFCGNGEHENPDLRVLSLIVERRMTEANGKPFKFYFNCHSSVAETAAAKAHMTLIEALVAQLEQQSAGRLTSQFLTGSFFELAI